MYFVRASLWVPCGTNSRLIKVEPLWRLPLTYLPCLEVALSDSTTCTKRSAPNKDHIIWYQSFDSWYRFYPIRHFFPSYFDVSFSVHVLFYNLSSCLFRLWFLIFLFFVFFFILFFLLLSLIFLECSIVLLSTYTLLQFWFDQHRPQQVR